MKDFPVIKIAILFIVGILSQKFFTVPVLLIIILFVVLILSLILLRYKNTPDITLAVSLIISFFVIAIGNFVYNLNHNETIQFFDDIHRIKNVTLYGEIDKIDLRREEELVLYTVTDSISSEKFFVKDKLKIMCRLKVKEKNLNELYNELKPGYKIKLNGTFYKGRERRNPGEFDYKKYLKSNGITAIFSVTSDYGIRIISKDQELFRNVIHQTRKVIDEQIKKYHTSDTASLLRGLLLADRGEIDYETKTQFINAGVIHVLAISGDHVGYIVLIFVVILGRFNIYIKSALTIIGLLFFTFITGAPPSVTRAVLMSIIIIAAFVLNRNINLFNSIAIAALIILIIDPNELFSPSFQLSFAAVLSIALIYPPIERLFIKWKINNRVIKYLVLLAGFSLSAQLGTLPFILLYFNKFSTVALLTNLIVVPSIAVILGIAIFTLTLSVIFPFIAIYYASANELITRYMFELIRFSGSLDFSYVSVNNYSLYDMILFYVLFFTMMISITKFKNVYAKIILVIFVTVNIYYLSYLDDSELLPDNNLSILMIDVGQGDSFLIKFPNGKTALIDAGNATFSFDNGERVVAPLLNHLGIEKVDYGFVSHLDADHYAGFVSLVMKGMIKEIYKPELDSLLSKDLKFENFLHEFGVHVSYYKQGALNIGNSRLYFLYPKSNGVYKKFSTNNQSGVIKLVYGSTSYLFTGDIERPAELIYADNFRNFLDSDMLKVPHHGSKTSSTNELLNYVTPSISLISAGIQNNFGHPSNEILLRLRAHDSKIYRTDIQKAVLLRSDGKRIQLIDLENI